MNPQSQRKARETAPAIELLAEVVLKLAEDGYTAEETLIAAVGQAAQFVRILADRRPDLMRSIEVGIENPPAGMPVEFFEAVIALRCLGESQNDCSTVPN